MSCFMRGSAERKMPVAFFLRGTKDIKGFSVKKLSKMRALKKMVPRLTLPSKTRLNVLFYES